MPHTILISASEPFDLASMNAACCLVFFFCHIHWYFDWSSKKEIIFASKPSCIARYNITVNAKINVRGREEKRTPKNNKSKVFMWKPTCFMIFGVSAFDKKRFYCKTLTSIDCCSIDCSKRKKDQAYCDASLEADGKTYFVHRAILASKSKHFDNLFAAKVVLLPMYTGVVVESRRHLKSFLPSSNNFCALQS